MTPPASNPFPPALYRQRLTLLASVLMFAQVMYLVMALLMLHGGFKPPKPTPAQQPVTLILFVLGLITTILSFPAARITARRQKPRTEFLKIAIDLGQQFFIGFAFSEVTALAGLAIFFLYADIQILIFLLSAATVSIGLHFLRVRRKMDEIIRSQR